MDKPTVYGRTIATCTVPSDRETLNDHMVQDGFTTYGPQYLPDEVRARWAGRGI